jgi:hypothetical protein
MTIKSHSVSYHMFGKKVFNSHLPASKLALSAEGGSCFSKMRSRFSILISTDKDDRDDEIRVEGVTLQIAILIQK